MGGEDLVLTAFFFFFFYSSYFTEGSTYLPEEAIYSQVGQYQII